MIKLLLINTSDDGTQRFQSQLMVGRDTVDFIMKDDGIMRCWGSGDKGTDFYEYNKPYEIVSDINEMKTQKL